MKEDSSDKIVLALSRLNSLRAGTCSKAVWNLIQRAKIMAADIREDLKDSWRPSVDRLCKCGHPYSKHQDANCEHEVGGVCMRHTCAKACNLTFWHRTPAKFLKRRACQCEEFRDRPGARLKP